MNVMFMGTPDFAIPTLEALTKSHNVNLVVTTPDKPRGRGHGLCPTEVGKWATEHRIEVVKPQTFEDGLFAGFLHFYKPDVIVVVAYGKILPEYILSYPKYGCINVHGSILPEYRGAAPMQRAIMDGKTEVGVTVMQMAKGLDTGDMLKVAKAPLGIDDNFEYVHDTLSKLGAEALIQTLCELENGQIVPVKQDEGLSTYAAKIEKEDRIIDFTESTARIHNKVRALSPVPYAFCYLNGKMIKIKRTSIANSRPTDNEPGTVISCKKAIEVATGDGTIEITELIPEGKKPMDARSFINGRGCAEGDKFTSNAL